MDKTKQIYINFDPSGDYLWANEPEDLLNDCPDEEIDEVSEKYIECYVRKDIHDSIIADRNNLRAKVAELEAEIKRLRPYAGNLEKCNGA